jgi:hypothetical protein
MISAAARADDCVDAEPSAPSFGRADDGLGTGTTPLILELLDLILIRSEGRKRNAPADV